MDVQYQEAIETGTKILSLFSDLLLNKWKECICMNANVYVNCREMPCTKPYIAYDKGRKPLKSTLQ